MVERSQAGAARKTTFWLAPAFAYLPVRIEHRERDGSVVVRIRSATGFTERDGA